MNTVLIVLVKRHFGLLDIVTCTSISVQRTKPKGIYCHLKLPFTIIGMVIRLMINAITNNNCW
jgi:hypothetical protein